MKANAMGFVLLALGVACGSWQAITLADEGKPNTVGQWEYRVLTREQILDLGKKDLAAGLNNVGDEGWELAAIDTVYIFKRPKDQNRKQMDALKRQLATAESDLEAAKDRAAWSERMAKKGYFSDQQVEAVRLQLRKAEMALDKARRDLKTLPADPKGPEEKERKPEK
jgi:hypothetical protein